VAEPHKGLDALLTAVAALLQLIFQFMARALQPTCAGRLNFAAMQRSQDGIRSSPDDSAVARTRR